MKTIAKYLMVAAMALALTAPLRATLTTYMTQGTGIQSDWWQQGPSDSITGGPWAPATSLYFAWPYQLTVVVDTDSVGKGSYMVGSLNWEPIDVVLQ